MIYFEYSQNIISTVTIDFVCKQVGTFGLSQSMVLQYYTVMLL